MDAVLVFLFCHHFFIDKFLIVSNIMQENLNESIVTMNKSLQELNRENMNSELLSQMWENYSKNSQFNLEATGQVQEPI